MSIPGSMRRDDLIGMTEVMNPQINETKTPKTKFTTEIEIEYPNISFINKLIKK